MIRSSLHSHNLLFAFVLIALLAVPGIAFSQIEGDSIGVGLALGSPTGPTVKYFMDDHHALDFDLGFFLLYNSLTISADYLYHFNALGKGKVTKAVIRPYVGGGGVFAYLDHFDPPNDKKDDPDKTIGVAARGVGGISFLFTKVPLELSIDLAPGLWLAPSVHFYSGGTVALKYFFDL